MNKRNQNKNGKGVLSYFKPYIFMAIITIIFVASAALLNLYLPNLMSDIVNKGVVKADTSYILSVGLKMLFFSLLSALFGVISHLTSAKVAASYARDLRTAIFNKVTNFSLEEFDKFSTSSLITRNTNDIVQIQQVTIMMMRMVIRAPVMGIGSIVMAFSLNMKLSEILFVSIPILIIGTILLITKTMPIFTNMQKKIDRINLVIRENLIGVRVIRAFNKEKHEENRFKEANEDLTKTALKVNRINALMFPLMSFIVNFTTIAVIFFGSKLIAMNELSIGNMMAVLQYVAQILAAFTTISMIFVFLPRAMASGKRLNEVLLTENSIVEPENPVKINSNISLQGYNNYTILKNTDSATKNSDLKYNLSLNETDQDLKIKDIIFQNVSFSYPNSKELALEDISFKIPHKMTTAIIGSTGSGKTTILNLILRMYDVKNGKILIQDEDIRNYSLEDLHNFFGYAPQKPVIFNDTIFENIRFGRDISEDEVIQAARIAAVYDFALKMEGGLYTIVAESGTNLSGGQKQRISIARAIAQKKDYYIFDDTFSALDFKTDLNIRTALQKVFTDSTIIIIAQRVSTIIHAENIIVLDDGRIAGIGSHADLMESCEIYQNIVHSQLSDKDIERI